ncbi:MAG TPA: DMT family transporter [Anaerolineales bacterium]|nr:DMT family transporter [Anaerolineales bacterium]
MTTADGRAFRLGALMCTTSAACYASLSILGKLAFSAGLSLTGMLSLRFAGAALVLAIVLALLRRPMFPGSRPTGKLVLLGALLYAPQAALFFTGLQRLPASIAVVLLYVYPVIVALFDWRMNGRLPGRRTTVAMGLALVGVVLTLYPQPTTSIDPVAALLVLASATGLSLYIVLSERATRAAGSRVSAMWIVAGAGLSFTLVGGASGSLAWEVAFGEPALVLALIVFGTVLPVTLFLAGVGRVGPTAASLLSTLEPVFTVALGVIVLQETLSAVQVVGGAFVLGAAVLVATRPVRRVEALATP